MKVPYLRRYINKTGASWYEGSFASGWNEASIAFAFENYRCSPCRGAGAVLGLSIEEFARLVSGFAWVAQSHESIIVEASDEKP